MGGGVLGITSGLEFNLGIIDLGYSEYREGGKSIKK